MSNIDIHLALKLFKRKILRMRFFDIKAGKAEHITITKNNATKKVMERERKEVMKYSEIC